jgi:cellulose biosynthesis protein BcsQ
MSTPYVITVSSEKGGVGKTTVATNLAIYLKALQENLPVTLLSFDNHFTVDRMFRLGRQNNGGNVADLLTGTPPEQLVELGQYGVQFIPSSHELRALRERLKTPETLAAVLAEHPLEGILIIDTPPVLDHITCNALYAADRVIVPVKDSPSLENSKHIFAFFEAYGLPRRHLRLLPCLIDSRIHFDGPFKDQYQLLKAYAINRGYRCLDGYIAKSPKVDSLATNPDGKIYPIISHGRGTEVHSQFADLARQVLNDYQQEQTLRIATIRTELAGRKASREAAFCERRSNLRNDCLICGKALVHPDHIGSAGFYWQRGDGSMTGYLEDNCFSSCMFQNFYRPGREVDSDDPLRQLFRESAQRSYFVLCQAPETRSHFQQQLAFYRFDEDGLLLSRKLVDLAEQPISPTLARLLAPLGDERQRLGDDFLLFRRVESDFPEAILLEEQHARLRTDSARIAEQLR